MFIFSGIQHNKFFPVDLLRLYIQKGKNSILKIKKIELHIGIPILIPPTNKVLESWLVKIIIDLAPTQRSPSGRG